jgi:hypothetical protein
MIYAFFCAVEKSFAQFVHWSEHQTFDAYEKDLYNDCGISCFFSYRTRVYSY